MTSPELEPVTHESFTLEPSYAPPNLRVRFSGTGDLDAISELGLFLSRVHQQCVERDVREVQFDFHDLKFMNSSCFKAFVTFIDHAKSTGVGYRIRFLTTPRHHWQRRSLEALRRLAMGLVTIEPES